MIVQCKKHGNTGKIPWNKGVIGTKYTKERCENIRKSLIGRRLSDEHRKNIGNVVRGRIMSKETKQKLREINMKRHLSEETKKKMSIAFKTQKPTSIELKVQNYLKEKNIKFEAQKLIWRYSADIYVPSKNLVIECDGTYWHSRKGAKEHDQKKNNFLLSERYNLIRLSEVDINNGNFKKYI